MRFAQISFLYWLWAVPIVVGFLVWANRNKQKKAHTFAAPNLFQEIAADFSAKQQTYKIILLVTVFIFSIITLARPQWGYEWRPVKRQGLDILIAIDTSKSMLTEDVK